MAQFKSVLIANRGEIACRVIQSVKEQGYRAIAVYSDADVDAPHVSLADDVFCIGPGPAGESYLNIEKILHAARETSAEAIHPGYGFLSENADFARAVIRAGMTFIGPNVQAIEIMGDKAAAKQHLLNAKVSCIPGYDGDAQGDDELILAAKSMSLPIMVKAAAGGGGRGMRLVESWEELASAISLARSEAESAFGDGRLILEQAILDARHVEVQVFADAHGNVVHFGERDCSVQRRHQKVIEESPCPVVGDELRERMGLEAVAVAKSVDYLGAGTVEFLLDRNQRFYFLEMNTRLQVEHPVTELVYGVDLVALQLKVAQGEKLAIDQAAITPVGHAIEVRLYAEDPQADFLPATGYIDRWSPAKLNGVRIDDGIKTGQTITPFYDAMVAKVIAYGPGRDVARQRLVRALRQTSLFGVQTNQSFLIDCLEKTTFAEGEATTSFIEREIGEVWEPAYAKDRASLDQVVLVAAALDHLFSTRYYLEKSAGSSAALVGWSSSDVVHFEKSYVLQNLNCTILLEDKSASSSVAPQKGGNHEFPASSSVSYALTTQWASSEGSEREISEDLNSYDLAIEEIEGQCATLTLDGLRLSCEFFWHEHGKIDINVQGQSLRMQDALLVLAGENDTDDGSVVLAPMHGVLLDVLVSEGQRVEKGQALMILEAMKMQIELVASAAGTISTMHAESGDQVAADQLLASIDVEAEE